MSGPRGHIHPLGVNFVFQRQGSTRMRSKPSLTLKGSYIGTSLAVHWLSLHAPSVGTRVRSLIGKLRFPHATRWQAVFVREWRTRNVSGERKAVFVCLPALIQGGRSPHVPKSQGSGPETGVAERTAFIGVQEKLGSGVRGRGRGSQGTPPLQPNPPSPWRWEEHRQTDRYGKTDRCYSRARNTPANPTPHS